jgi:aldehyde:ferredoxin oxidoreductase
MLMQPILKVDLSSGQAQSFEVPSGWERGYLGGASLAARLLYPELKRETDPLSPESQLLFLTGPLTGTAGPAVGRFVVAGRSPATGLWGESNCGGFWGPELRQAGFDGLWLTGRSAHPVYLWIRDGQVEVRDAADLWGLDTYETQEAVQSEVDMPGVRVVVIGPAGERKIPFSLILCDHGRVAGRTGLGAVMGSKRLKAVAVKGSGRVPIARQEIFSRLRGQANRALRDDSFTAVMKELGSAGGADYFDYLGEMPKRYFQRGEFAGSERVSGTTVTEELLSGVSTCHACVIACGRVVRLGDGVDRKGPEYETLVGFGPNLWIDDPIAVTQLGELCDRYGMDTISLSNTIGLAFTLFEEGVISPSDAEGRDLSWGNAEVVEELIHITARRDGFGAELADGSLALGRRYGVEGAAVQVNGLEVPYHDPRGASGMAMVYATSPRGACHNQSDYFLVDIGQVDEELDLAFHSRQAGAEKSANIVRHQNWRTVCNALVLCFFANVSPHDVLKLVNAARGDDLTFEELMRSGERGWTLKRIINNRLGLRREHDRLPERLMKPLPDGGSQGYVPDFKKMLKAYYRFRGWDWETGFPTREKLLELGLMGAADGLWPGN